MPPPLPDKRLLLLIPTSQAVAYLHILLAHHGLDRQTLPGGPDLTAGVLLAAVVLGDDLARGALEEDGRLFELGVQEAVDEDAGVEVLLRVVAQDLVLAHDFGVHLADQFEVLTRGVSVLVDLVVHGRLVGAGREELLDHDEVRSVEVM